jgi:hypothetical protein
VRRARQAVGGRRRPPPRTLPAVARAAAATAAQATRAERAAAALAAEMEGLARARRDVMRRRRQERLDDALAAAVDESAVDETEAGGAGTAERLAHPGVCAKGVGEFRVYSTLTTANRLSWPYKPCLASSVCKGDGVVSQRGPSAASQPPVGRISATRRPHPVPLGRIPCGGR